MSRTTFAGRILTGQCPCNIYIFSIASMLTMHLINSTLSALATYYQLWIDVVVQTGDFGNGDKKGHVMMRLHDTLPPLTNAKRPHLFKWLTPKHPLGDYEFILWLTAISLSSSCLRDASPNLRKSLCREGGRASLGLRSRSYGSRRVLNQLHVLKLKKYV